jgi:hypothetical protein
MHRGVIITMWRAQAQGRLANAPEFHPSGAASHGASRSLEEALP